MVAVGWSAGSDSEWQWHLLGYMQVCSRSRHNHASTPPLSFLQAGCPSCRSINSVKALKAKTPFYLLCSNHSKEYIRTSAGKKNQFLVKKKMLTFKSYNSYPHHYYDIFCQRNKHLKVQTWQNENVNIQSQSMQANEAYRG